MFNTSIVTTGLLGLVGYRQPFDPAFPVLDANNLTTNSGLVVNDNSFAKLEYLLDAQDYSEISTSEFNDYLQTKQKLSIVNVCNAVFNKASYIDRQVLYKNAFNKVESETLPSGFVGFEIKVASEKNIAFKISRILLDFEGAGDIELLLFNTALKAPIESKVITISSDHQSETLDWEVDNSLTTYKGDYYLGYLSNYASIGTLKPYKKDYNNGDLMSNVTYLNIDRGIFPSMSTNVLPDLNDWDGNSQSTGLNPDITVYEDFTDLIVNNKSLFSRAIWYDMQISVLSEVASSIRSNRNTRIGKDMLSRIIVEIEGAKAETGIAVTGLRPRYYGAIKIITKEIQELQKGYFGDGNYITTMM